MAKKSKKDKDAKDNSLFSAQDSQPTLFAENSKEWPMTPEEGMGYGDDFDEGYYYDEDEDDDTMLKPDCNEGTYFKLRISLDDSPVEVSRILVVPSHIRLSMLSNVIVRAMGWDGSHLSQFIKGKVHYCSKTEIEKPNGNKKRQDYSKVALNEVLKRKGTNIRWEYDQGDSWEHTIALAGRIRTKKPVKIEVTEATGACPPDDCGGVWRYSEMLDILNKKRHPNHAEAERWLGKCFNPSHVSINTLNNGLKCFNQ